MRWSPRWTILIVVVLLFGAGSVGLLFAGSRQHKPQASSAASPNAASVDRLQLGGTLTQKTGLTEPLPTKLLNQSVSLIGVSLSGNGTADPEPQPGVFDWSSLDTRMRQFEPLQASLMLRVFEAPPWMTGGKSKGAVKPRFYRAFAQLVLSAAERYPQIHYFAIWNELAGFRSDPSHWDYEAYTRLYNVLYGTLKQFNPALNVGGPYAPFPATHASGQSSSIVGAWGALDRNSLDTITYWLAHKQGADFIAIDGRTAFPGAVPSDPVGSTKMFAVIDRWIEQQTALPIWWTEWYARSPELGAPEWNAVSAYALIQIANSGASGALIWDPEFQPGHSTATPGIWVSQSEMGTALTPVFHVLKNDMFGTPVRLSSPTSGVEVLANASHFIAIDLDGRAHSVTVVGTSVDLTSFAIATG